MFQLLILISLLATNVYGVTLDASFLAQLGYNNQSSTFFLSGYDINNIDPNVFKGYTKLTYMNLRENSLTKIDLGVFNTTLLQYLDLSSNPSLTNITNTKKILFPLMQYLNINGCPLTTLDANFINSVPNITYFDFQNQVIPLKINQLTPLKKLQSLYITTKNQSTLTKDYFTGLTSLSTLLFTDSHLKTVNVQTLTAMPNLTSVDFSDNDITAFEYLQCPGKLDTLRLTGNKMNYFMLSRTTGYVRYLYLNYNLFRSFKSMDFTFLANLTYLDLSNNPHAYPAEISGHMKPLINLTEVVLTNLSVNTIDVNFFKYNTNIQRISLNLNNISVVAYNAFVNTDALNYLDMSNNPLGVLDNRTFSGLYSLRFLYLQSNKLKKVSTRTFYNLTAMNTLDLSNNLITEIESTAFSGFYNLMDLRLGYNQISKIWPRAFENLKTYSLKLNYNLITLLDNSTFNGLRVNYLSLSNNNISRFNPGTFKNVTIFDVLELNNNVFTKLENDAFVGLNRVRAIYLNNNKIATIETGAFNGMTYLQTVYINNNLISAIDSGTFNSLTYLQYVYMNNNSIVQLDSLTFDGCNNLQEIYLYNNSIPSTADLTSLCPTAAEMCQVYF